MRLDGKLPFSSKERTNILYSIYSLAVIPTWMYFFCLLFSTNYSFTNRPRAQASRNTGLWNLHLWRCCSSSCSHSQSRFQQPRPFVVNLYLCSQMEQVDGKCTRVSLLETKQEPAITYHVAIMQSTLSTTLNDSV